MRNAATITAISAKIAAAISRTTGTEVPVITAEEIAAFRPGANPAADTPLAAYILALTPEALRELGTQYPFLNEDIREVIVNLTQYAKFSTVAPGWHRPAHDEADLAPEEIAARREDEYLNRIPREYWPDAPDGTPRTDADMEAAEVKIEAEAKLTAWAAVRGQRDDLVRAALAAGVTKSRIHELTGISRATIDRIPGVTRPITEEQPVDRDALNAPPVEYDFDPQGVRPDIARGAAWLDETAPGWEGRVDLSQLDMSSNFRDVLSQALDGDFLGLVARHFDGDRAEAARHGFDLPQSQRENELETTGPYERLTTGWWTLIQQRRQA